MWCWLVVIVCIAPPARVRAQSVRQFAAWDALMVSPVGAFPTSDDATNEARPNSLALRFGRWRYNADDAAHETYGLTLSHAVGSRSHASLTGAYVHVSCGDCAPWAAWGADVESRVLEMVTQGTSTTLGFRLSAGGAGLRGAPRSIARTVAFEMPVSVRVRYGTHNVAWASLNPGAGYGNMWGPSGSDGTTLQMLGMTVGSNLTSSLGVELGAHRVFIAGGPIDLGISFAWALR